MTFKSEPPTKPGYYVAESDGGYSVTADVYVTQSGALAAIISGYVRTFDELRNYKWSPRLVPVDEVEKAFREGAEKGWRCSPYTSVGELYGRSRAKQVVEGEL